MISASSLEDLAEMKAQSSSKQTLLGNFDAIKLRVMPANEIEAMVKESLLKGGKNGGYIFSDHHGELPWQITFDQLDLLTKYLRKWGKYPLNFTL